MSNFLRQKQTYRHDCAEYEMIRYFVVCADKDKEGYKISKNERKFIRNLLRSLAVVAKGTKNKEAL
jgi:hypothetical protein